MDGSDTVIDTETAGDGASATGVRSGTGLGTGHGGYGSNSVKSGRSRQIELRKKRITSIDEAKVTAKIIPFETGRVKMRVEEVGADFSESLFLKKSSDGEVSDGAVIIKLNAGEEVSLEMVVDRPVVGGVKLVIEPDTMD